MIFIKFFICSFVYPRDDVMAALQITDRAAAPDYNTR